MPGIYYQDAGSQRAASSLYYQDGASQRAITEAWYQDGANLRKVWPPESISLTNHSINATRVGATASAAIDLLNTGVAQSNRTPGGTTSFAPEWMSSGTASDYESRWTSVSGSINIGTAGVWQNLGTSRSYGVSRGSLGTTSCTGTLEIRHASTGIIKATATIDVAASWTT